MFRGDYMKMSVVNKDTNIIFEVYDITYNKVGYPHFLIYKDNQWMTMSAEHFRPAETDDVLRAWSGYLKG